MAQLPRQNRYAGRPVEDMPIIKRARVFEPADYKKLCKHIRSTSLMPERDLLIVALSFKAGLRIGEIAGLRIAAMVDASGNTASHLVVGRYIAKKHSEREITIMPELREAIDAFRAAYPKATVVAISSQKFRGVLRNGQKLPADALFDTMTYTACRFNYQNLLDTFAKKFGFEGASTHSGRRTFGTNLARKAPLAGASLRDVQRLMGHRFITTTEIYVDARKDDTGLLAFA